MLNGKRIVIGITGSIAAYKIPLLVRLLIKEGADVRVVMTSSSIDFVTPLTLSTVSKNPVSIEFSHPETGEWVNHVELGLWADLLIIAPLSANTLAKMSHGFCDNLLMGVYLSAKCKVMAVPAMDLDMWKHPSTTANLERIKQFGVSVIMPAHGELASGLIGEGRMEEPENIFQQVRIFFESNLPFKNKKILVTAGPTYEKVDAVRYIGNRSSGKMGFAIASEFANQGAEVTLISGPTHLLSDASIHRVNVESADQMHSACMKYFLNQDVVVMSAAVADYTPDKHVETKIKKENNTLQVSLKPTIDILAEMGKIKKQGQLLAGFALETDNEHENAQKKIINKNLDLIILNSLNDKGAGFSHDTNKITILDKDFKQYSYDLKPKELVAKDIVNFIFKKMG